jgi:hypothetical protein
MKHLILHILILTLLSSCHSTKTSDGVVSKEESVKVDQQAKKEEHHPKVVQSELMGIWAKDKDENALFEINDDTIYYVEHPDSPVHYELNDSVWTIFYDDLTTKNIILKLDGDSLVFKTEIGVVNRLYRR